MTCAYPSTITVDVKNVTEEDLWKAFNIKLNDNMAVPSPIKPVIKQKPPISKKPQKVVEVQQEDPDYDENPYDNVPYINVGSLRRHNTPETNTDDLYKEILKRHHNHEPRMACIPETC